MLGGGGHGGGGGGPGMVQSAKYRTPSLGSHRRVAPKSLPRHWLGGCTGAMEAVAPIIELQCCNENNIIVNQLNLIIQLILNLVINLIIKSILKTLL